MVEEYKEGAAIRDGFDPAAIWDELLFSYHVLKRIHIKLTRAPLLGNVGLLMARELELGPV